MRHFEFNAHQKAFGAEPCLPLSVFQTS